MIPRMCMHLCVVAYDRNLAHLHSRWVLFETGPFTHDPNASGGIKMVPAPYGEHDDKMATKWGRLMHELLLAPVPILVSMRNLLHDVAGICAEEYTSSYVPLLTWLSRTAARIAAFAQHQDAELSRMLRSTAAERDPKKAILVVSATGGKQYARPRPPICTISRACMCMQCACPYV